MGYLGAVLLVAGVAAIIYVILDIDKSKIPGDRKGVIVAAGILAALVGFILIDNNTNTTRCDELAAQGKEVLMVKTQCWVSVGNDLFIQTSSKQTEVKTRAELSAE